MKDLSDTLHTTPQIVVPVLVFLGSAITPLVVKALFLRDSEKGLGVFWGVPDVVFKVKTASLKVFKI